MLETAAIESRSQAEDLELVAAVLRKDRKATARFVTLYADAVYAYVRQRLIPRADLVEDLVQEVFLAAWEKLGAFRGQSALRSWLIGIARHKVEDYYRARLRQPEPVEDTADAELAVDPAFDEWLDRERTHAKTRQILETLPEAYAAALLWRYWERRSAQDMAAATGKSEKAVERLLARARAQFKRRWNGE